MPRLIDLSDVLAVINASMLNLEYTDENRAMQKAISMLPTVDAVEVVHGQWYKVFDDDGSELWLCSVCCEEWEFSEGHPKYDYGCNYCPNCGAKMDEGEDG